ncbi:hypothetical protein [Enterovibrio norvegicus]|uniref:hypothetical protein n=1 Tax=Enterovibrio norvegicus TaxID=188144 RepID=UPI000C833778|nr:hypothetical protein [Enterovibrio norvegicus]PMH64557.1 hypothetical protein BCU62_16000 [Enterovibrio norvegicus]
MINFKQAIFMMALTLSFPSSSSSEMYIKDTSINQSSICHVEESFRAGSQCKDGEIMLFIPVSGIGAGRTSIVLSSLVCDFRFNIIRTSDALTCVFSTKRKNQWAEFSMETPK